MEESDPLSLKRREAEALAAYRQSSNYYAERWRPQFHFSPERNWINDPNGLVFDGHLHHLCYQHNPLGVEWGHMSWGHAVSEDLLHWRHRPVALWEEAGESIFSGSAIVDEANSSGLGNAASPPIVAAYTSARPGNQAQSLASSCDGGVTWRKYEQNPVLDLGSSDFRDPRLLWHAPTSSWVMAVAMAEECRVLFCRSSDLKKWTVAGEFGPVGIAGKATWECPELLELNVLDSDGAVRTRTAWLLKVDVDRRATSGRCGAEYFVGQFDGYRFSQLRTGAVPLSVDFGGDFFAAQSWSRPLGSEGTAHWIGWMGSWDAPLTPTSPWRHAMTIPRTLALRETTDGIRLVQQPLAALQNLRGERVDGRTQSVRGVQLDIEIEIELSGSEPVELCLFASDEEYTAIRYDPRGGELAVDRSQAGQIDYAPDLATKFSTRAPSNEGILDLRVLLDRSSVELFANEGLAVSTLCVFPSEQSDRVLLDAAKHHVRRFDAWPIQSVWRK